MSDSVQQLAALATGFAARHVYPMGGEFRCSECLRAWTEKDQPKHAPTCVVLQIAELAVAVCCEELDAIIVAQKMARVEATQTGSEEVYAEPWRIATSSDADPCRDVAGALVNAKDELILSLYSPDVDYRHAPSLLWRIKECVNFFAGVPTLAIIGTGELTRERMAEVGGVGAAQGPVSGVEPCADGATA